MEREPRSYIQTAWGALREVPAALWAIRWKVVRRLLVLALMYALGHICEGVPEWAQPACVKLAELLKDLPL